MKLTQSQLKQIVKEEISKTLNEVNLPFWFVKVGHDTVRVPKEQAGGLKLETPVQALEWAILNRLNHPEINRKMKKRIVDFVAAFYTVGDLETGKQHEKIEVSDSFLETNKDLLDKYGSTLEERNNTKITESQLRKIIKEELKAVRADQLYITEMFDTGAVGGDPGTTTQQKKAECPPGTKWVEPEGGYGHCKEIEELEEADRLESAPALDAADKLKSEIGKLYRGTEFATTSNLDAILRHYRMGKDRAIFNASVNKILNDESTPEAEAAELKNAYEQRIARQ